MPYCQAAALYSLPREAQVVDNAAQDLEMTVNDLHAIQARRPQGNHALARTCIQREIAANPSRPQVMQEYSQHFKQTIIIVARDRFLIGQPV